MFLVILMLYNFKREKLDKLLYDFYALTGLATSVWDSQVNLLSYEPKDMCRFCTAIKTTALGRQRCFESDRKVCMESKIIGKPATHICHAGLVDTAVPVKFEDEVVGYIIFGQIREKNENNINEKIIELSKQLNLDYKELQEAYCELDKYDEIKINAAATIMKNIAKYLWFSEYIEAGNSSTASRIDDYIRANLKEQISVKNICEKFFISKNRLYDISHQWFKMTIGEYITFLRMEEAKKLLTTSNMPVHEVGSSVGINDYNYFTKVFKSCVGTPPLKYRKGVYLDNH